MTLILSGPSPTAIGGTQDIALQYDPTTGHFVPLDLPYTADDDGGIGVAIDHTAGSVVSVRGVASRTNYLRIIDATTGELFDRKELTGAAIDSLSLVAGTTRGRAGRHGPRVHRRRRPSWGSRCSGWSRRRVARAKSA